MKVHTVQDTKRAKGYSGEHGKVMCSGVRSVSIAYASLQRETMMAMSITLTMDSNTMSAVHA